MLRIAAELGTVVLEDAVVAVFGLPLPGTRSLSVRERLEFLLTSEVRLREKLRY